MHIYKTNLIAQQNLIEFVETSETFDLLPCKINF